MYILAEVVMTAHPGSKVTGIDVKKKQEKNITVVA